MIVDIILCMVWVALWIITDRNRRKANKILDESQAILDNAKELMNQYNEKWGWVTGDEKPPVGVTVLVLCDNSQVLMGTMNAEGSYNVPGTLLADEATRVLAWQPLPKGIAINV